MNDSDLFVTYFINRRSREIGIPAADLVRALLKIPAEQIRAAADEYRASTDRKEPPIA